MAQETISAFLNDFSTQYARLIEQLYTEARGERWGLSRHNFAVALRRGADKRFRGTPSGAAEIEAYLRSLHLEDLALACACSEGSEVAWEFFIAHFRQELRNACRAILRGSSGGNDSRAEELADSLHAELYGIRSGGDGQRKSLFEYFHGRSKLSTWLRAVLAQRHVDMLRADRGTISVDSTRGDMNEEIGFKLGPGVSAAPVDPDRARYLAQLDRALAEALARLRPRERLLLACYYVDQLTLAEIGKTFGEHESTVSRQLDRTRRALRETVTNVLRQGAPARGGHAADPPLDRAQLQAAFEYAIEDWPFDLSQALSKAESSSEPRKE